jgi:protein involved in polysaccharide export with SLBB domain
MLLQRMALWVSGFVLLSTFAQAADEPQASQPKADQPATKAAPARLEELPLIDPETIKPGPLAPIPDDPPPHEGALIDLPYIIEPPDLLIIEVLEALPGRPISGARLVRPDGKINLGFYGEVHVRGLTLQQAKEKIVLQLRAFLDDELLGLVVPDDAEPAAAEHGAAPNPERRGEEPTGEGNPPTARHVFVRPNDAAPVRLYGRQDNNPAHTPPPQRRPVTPHPSKTVRIAPADTDRVIVDVTAYNSKFYYVQGDMAALGKMPWTGNETVLDALHYAGGFIATADRKNIHLYRPARGGKPLKVLPIDVDAIERGEAKLNYQLFPGDRLVVGRDAFVMQTIQQDRLAGSFQTMVNSLMSLSFMTRAFNQAAPNLTAAQTEAIMKEWFDLWWKAVHTPGGPKPDEAAFRELLLKSLRRPAEAGPAKK